MCCLSNPRGQLLFELFISLFIMSILLTGLIVFLLIKDYEYSFQVGNIVLLYFISATISLFYRARILRCIGQERLLQFKSLLKVFFSLQIFSLVVFITVILYCLVEILSQANIWNDFNKQIMQDNFSGNASFFLIFIPIHLYYLMLSHRLKKILTYSGDDIDQLEGLLIQQNSRVSSEQGEKQTASFISEDCPKEIKYDSTCSICQEEIFNSKVVAFSCEHIFHSQCIRSWLKTKKNTCPNCRTSIVQPRRSSMKTTLVLHSQTEQDIESGQIST